MNRIWISIALVAGLLGIAPEASAQDFTVHWAKFSAKTLEQDGAGNVKKLNLNTKRMINFLKDVVDLDTQVPKNQRLVLLVACPWGMPAPETQVARLAVWDKVLEQLVVGSEWIYEVERRASRIKDATVVQADVAIDTDSAPFEVSMTGTFKFRPLGKKFGIGADTICASGFKSATVQGGIDGNWVWLKGKLKAGKPFAILD
jgi:hypothetical protein